VSKKANKFSDYEYVTSYQLLWPVYLITEVYVGEQTEFASEYLG